MRSNLQRKKEKLRNMKGNLTYVEIIVCFVGIISTISIYLAYALQNMFYSLAYWNPTTRKLSLFEMKPLKSGMTAPGLQWEHLQLEWQTKNPLPSVHLSFLQ